MDIDTLERILTILAWGGLPGDIELKLNEIEAVYITEKILKLPTRLTELQRIGIGENIIRKIWGENINGDIQTIKW